MPLLFMYALMYNPNPYLTLSLSDFNMTKPSFGTLLSTALQFLSEVFPRLYVNKAMSDRKSNGTGIVFLRHPIMSHHLESTCMQELAPSPHVVVDRSTILGEVGRVDHRYMATRPDFSTSP